MPGAIGDTEAAVFIPEVWSAKTVEARTGSYYMADRVDRWDEDVKDYGDTIHRPRVSEMAASDVGADGSVSLSNPTEGEVSITLSYWKAVGFRITDKVQRQSKVNIANAYTKMAGKGLAKIIETGLLGLYSGITTYVLTAQATIDQDMILTACADLDISNVPEDDRFCIVYPTQKKAILKIDQIIANLYLGDRNQGGDSIRTGRFNKEIYGIEFLSSPLVPLSTTYKNMMWHRSAFALAVQTKVSMEELARDGFRRTYAAGEVYGIGEVRDEHVVLLPTTG